MVMELFPIQTKDGKGGKIAESVYRRAYEVYSAVYGAQEELLVNGCRCGFSTCELIAFLYAYPFPKEQWFRKINEVFKNKENI